MTSHRPILIATLLRAAALRGVVFTFQVDNSFQLSCNVFLAHDPHPLTNVAFQRSAKCFLINKCIGRGFHVPRIHEFQLAPTSIHPVYYSPAVHQS